VHAPPSGGHLCGSWLVDVEDVQARCPLPWVF